jgi:uncharacterized membrane protein
VSLCLSFFFVSWCNFALFFAFFLGLTLLSFLVSLCWCHKESKVTSRKKAT